MAPSPDQRGILLAALLALIVVAGGLAAGYYLLPSELLSPGEELTTADRLAFALRWDLPLFLWLMGCVQAVSTGRYHSPDDIRGSAFGRPSKSIAVKRAVLQNSLEQVVIAVGAHLILATMLHPDELRLIPLLVILFLLGRIAFAFGYRHGPGARGIGMAITGLTNIVGYGAAIYLMLAGR